MGQLIRPAWAVPAPLPEALPDWLLGAFVGSGRNGADVRQSVLGYESGFRPVGRSCPEYKNETENTSPGLIVEETVGWNSSDEMAQSAALDEAAQADDATGAANTAMDGEVTDNRTADNVMTDNVSQTANAAAYTDSEWQSQNAVATDADAESSTARQSASASDSFPQVQEAWRAGKLSGAEGGQPHRYFQEILRNR